MTDLLNRTGRRRRKRMTDEKYKEIKSKADKIKETVSREKGALGQLMEQFHTLMGDTKATIDDGIKRAEDLKARISTLEKKWDAACARLEKVTDWDKV
jgi:chromosome segregation ATPase